MTFTVKLALPSTGRWRVIAVYSGAPMYADATTSARGFTVN